MTETPIEIVRLRKLGGPLTKRISLLPNGTLNSDGSACVMSEGLARRAIYRGLGEFADDLLTLDSAEAIALGALRPDLPATVRVTTKAKLDELNGEVPSDLIARTGNFITYRSGHATLAMIDIDAKGMPQPVRERISDAGGYWQALTETIPALAGTARVIRRSTSTGLYHAGTGEKFAGSQGIHAFVLVRDGADVERFLRTLHQRCWLAGYGWMMVGAAGQLLERSLVDRMVYAPERLVFEGAPVLDDPVAQDGAVRRPATTTGEPLDTETACPPLSKLEDAALRRLLARERARLKPDSEKAQHAFIVDHGTRIAARTGLSQEDGERIVRTQLGGALLPDVVLEWDDPTLAGRTVGDVLADPKSYIGVTLADPFEGVQYGAGKAMVMQRADGTLWIHSFAHGRTTYSLHHDFRSAQAKLDTAPDDKVARVYTDIMLAATLDATETEILRTLAAKRSGIGKRALDTGLKRQRAEQTAQQANEARERRLAERIDRRPQLAAPIADAPWLPEMKALNDVLGASRAAEPPMRDIDGIITQVRVRSVPSMHALIPDASNAETAADIPPAPEQPLLTRLSDVQLAELIEQHIDYTDATGRSVHLGPGFVRHFHTRHDNELPTIAAIATLPLVLPDGKLLAGVGLDRERGIVFRIAGFIRDLLPSPAECGPTAVAEAVAFLTDEWLADVATDYPGKCTLVAAAATVMERVLLPDRPAFFVTAGRRGGGKTTSLLMLLTAITGIRPSAAAWSTNEEERRKAILAYLADGVPAIIWDNIARGSRIGCPHIEKACTSAFYSDRKLGVSELISVAASAIHFFTGNNITPAGDLASRSLKIRLEVDRPDPENREFAHADPIGWTEINRGRILRAIYVILMGAKRAGAPRTRFKTWWHLIGSAVEYAARQHHEHVAAGALPVGKVAPARIDFSRMFLSQEEEEEESASLADALAVLSKHDWPKSGSFMASDVAKVVNDQSEYRSDADIEHTTVLREFLFPKGVQGQTFTPKAVANRLKLHLGEPVIHGDFVLILEAGEPDSHAKSPTYFVRSRRV